MIDTGIVRRPKMSQIYNYINYQIKGTGMLEDLRILLQKLNDSSKSL